MKFFFDSLEVGAGETIRHSRVLAYLLTCEGVVECSALKLNDGTENITLTPEQVPQAGDVTITKGGS